MNYIEIKYSFWGSKATITINGEKVSTYSEMTVLMNQPFHEIGTKIISMLDKEIYDAYEINFYGMKYQYLVLEDCRKHSELCQKIVFNELSETDKDVWNYAFIMELAEKYQLQVMREKTSIDVHQSMEEAIAGQAEYNVILSDRYDFIRENEKYIFYIVRSEVDVFMDYFEIFCHKIPQYEKIINGLKYIRLNEEDKVGVNVCLYGKPDFYMENIPSSMDVGEEKEIQFVSFPEEHYFVKTKNNDILVFQNNCLKARKGGVGTLEVAEASGTVIETRKIEIIEHNFVKEIRVISQIPYLKVNEKKKIEVIAIPAEAEDAGNLKWIVENPAIAHINENGELIALAEGKTELKICGKRAELFIGIEVKPMVKTLRFQESQIRMKPGETIVVECEIIPPEAACENLQWSFDNEAIVSYNPSLDGKKCKLQAKSEHTGKGNLRCIDKEQKISTVCNVEVVKVKTAGTLAGFAIASLVLGFLCLPIFTPLSLILSIIGYSSTESETDKKTFKTCLIICAVEIVIVLLVLMISAASS